MGACFKTRSYPGNLTCENLRERFSDDQDQDSYENGHMYSGGIGMACGLEFTNKSFSDKDTAYDWLSENCQKWGPALAVRFVNNNGIEKWMVGAMCAS